MSELERITARRSELDALAEELAKRLGEVEAEREELGIAEQDLHLRSGRPVHRVGRVRPQQLIPSTSKTRPARSPPSDDQSRKELAAGTRPRGSDGLRPVGRKAHPGA